MCGAKKIFGLHVFFRSKTLISDACLSGSRRCTDCRRRRSTRNSTSNSRLHPRRVWYRRGGFCCFDPLQNIFSVCMYFRSKKLISVACLSGPLSWRFCGRYCGCRSRSTNASCSRLGARGQHLQNVLLFFAHILEAKKLISVACLSGPLSRRFCGRGRRSHSTNDSCSRLGARGQHLQTFYCFRTYFRSQKVNFSCVP